MNILSLGGGVQSTAIALMAEKGELTPKLDAAIFADTDWEPKYIDTQMEWLKAHVSYPVFVVDCGRSLREDVIAHTSHSGNDAIMELPVYLVTEKGDGMARRQCTYNYKISPIRRKIREMMGLKKGQRVPKNTMVKLWMGITLDEVGRAKDSQEWWIENYYPLIFEKPMRRSDCDTWLVKNYPEITVQKSACVGCPYHSDRAWVYMAENVPEQFAEAIEIDESLRSNPTKYRGEAYLHQSRRPLKDAVKDSQLQGDIFGFEGGCEEGYCGV